MDALVIAEALAARYRTGTLAPPTGYGAVRVATSKLPNAIPTSPWVLVMLPQGEIIFDGGGVSAELEYHVLFHYAKHTGDLGRDMAGMLAWIGPLLLATAGQTKLGLGVTEQVKSALPGDFKLAVFTYGGQEYYGWDITCTVILRDLAVTLS